MVSSTKKRTTKKNLVIVESPTKAQTIERYLGRNYRVVASKGHIRDLPKSKMGVDIENSFKPEYISIRGKGPVIKDLKKEAAKAKQVYLASDPDREGEAIAWHVSHILGLKETDKNRVVFNEITKDTVKEAFKNPRQINMNLVDAQQARRVLDRIVGYSISPILWRKVKKGLSAGRVQSVALKLIIDRQNEIDKFVPEEYWTIEANFKKDRKTFIGEFYGVGGKKKKLSNDQDVKEVITKLDKKKEFNVTDVKKRQTRKNPNPAFTTSTLQQVANRKLNFHTKKTMMLAQQLYEGVNLGGKTGHAGLITYMRTDSVRVSPTAVEESHKFILDKYGKEYVGSRVAKNNKKEKVQDAHEAIRPSSVLRTPQSLKDILSRDQLRLYTLIWDRFVASQMSAAVYDTMSTNVEQNDVQFQVKGSKLVFPGFTKVYKDSDSKNDGELPDLKTGDKVTLSKLSPAQHFTQPPAKYTEASLVKALEENGVGRPSTFSPIIDTLQKRYYVKLNAKRFEPTDLGKIVNNIIEEFFPEIVNIGFTADIETNLDNVEQGINDWVSLVDKFYQKFEPEVDNADKKIEKIEFKFELVGDNCPECGAPLVYKMGRYGKFIACSRFPDCRYTKAVVKEIGMTCPVCHEGEVIEKHTKRNRLFYGCSRYPKCEFMSWDKPVPRNCPNCDHFLVEKKVKNTLQVVCPNGDYAEEVQK
ncbi:type I DNA topoisomerase [Xylocopilactobacillus apis]|uniref:DNA topoisomerase 1 n=1 Tax=Xylocopilactobacillus apis TaxID=2932183 RepID=A0AAU9DLQ7_9LACO|nr:type I DNA topoisomerase [Xylocopilactobacillus apis]BDR56524.1 DNA topoisomerase 1 [Xylocopilactobacillus apis]